MDGFIDSSLTDIMKIDDREKPVVKKIGPEEVHGLKKNIDPKTNRFIFKRTPAGEKVRTLVEMKGDEIIRQGVDAAYNYLNGRRAGLTSNIIEETPMLPAHRRSLLSVIWPFIVGVGATLFFMSMALPNGLTDLF